MVLSTTKIINTIQWLITVFMSASFLLFDSYTWGKYSHIICAVLIFLLTVIKNKGKIRICLAPYILFLAVFSLFIALTSIWAITPSDTLQMTRTMLRTLGCFALVYWAYMDDDDPYRIVTAIIFASYVVAIYSITVFGFDKIVSVSSEIFSDESFANINSISMFLAFGIICELYLILFRGFRWYSLLTVLSIVVIAASRTRKSIVFVVLGVVLLLLFRFSKSKSVGFRLLRIVSVLFIAFSVVYIASQLPIFASVNMRLEQMLNTFLGEGKMDTSSLMRNELVELGLFCFSKKPLTGIGMACTHSYAWVNLYFDAYLHNNYVELLAGGGIFAFIIFYSMYVYLIWGFFKIKREAPEWFAFGIVMIMLMLLADFGRVSYYSKPVLFELMMLFLIVRIVRRRKETADVLEAP